MSLNKRKCREFADPGLKFQTNNGILHANQISYVIRTAVKIIDHRKTLVLYVYLRARAAKGDCRPCYTVFQTREEFLTLAEKEDGTAVWRVCAFDALEGGYNFSDHCSFYSAKDEGRVIRYLKANVDDGCSGQAFL